RGGGGPEARTAAAFSNPSQSLGNQIRSVLGFPQGSPLAVSTRAVGFLSQIHYPPAVEGNPPGPFGRDPNDPNSTTLQQRLSPSCAPSGNGITIFPGGLPLYKGGALVGAVAARTRRSTADARFFRAGFRSTGRALSSTSSASAAPASFRTSSSRRKTFARTGSSSAAPRCPT